MEPRLDLTKRIAASAEAVPPAAPERSRSRLSISSEPHPAAISPSSPPSSWAGIQSAYECSLPLGRS
jgi:hypothetical protein